jgi:DNA-directed RNA polymerase specialized sigma subunit
MKTIITTTFAIIALIIALGALIYAIKEYISARKALKAYKAYVQEECKQRVVHYDIPQLPTKENIIKVACSLGYTQRRIAKIVGLSQSTVFRIMRKHGWKKNIIKGKE